jgi:hypothetical protein
MDSDLSLCSIRSTRRSDEQDEDQKIPLRYCLQRVERRRSADGSRGSQSSFIDLSSRWSIHTERIPFFLQRSSMTSCHPFVRWRARRS